MRQFFVGFCVGIIKISAKSVITSKITYTISLIIHNFSIQISIMTIIKLDKIAHCQNSFACQPPAKLLNGITARRKSPTASHLPVIKSNY